MSCPKGGGGCYRLVVSCPGVRHIIIVIHRCVQFLNNGIAGFETVMVKYTEFEQAMRIRW